jgi:hypothetical protein
MPRRCRSIAGLRVDLGPGDPIIPGCELIEGSGIFVSKEEFPMMFAEVDGVAGDNGAVVIWPDTGNDLFQYDEGESIPIGTTIHSGCVKYSDGEIQCAPPPFTTDRDSVAVAGPPPVDGSGDGEDKGFCVGAGNVDMPSDDTMQWLTDLANLQVPDLEGWILSGFTAEITKLMSKLGQVLGKLQSEVDKIISKAKLDPEDVCTPPVKKLIGNMLAVMKELMKLLPILKQIIKIIKLIQKVMKLVREILKWTPPFIVPLVEKLLELLNIMGMVDMLISVLLKTVGRFTAIIPMLQAQLMSILAMCAAQAGQPPPDNKEDCEAAGGTWIDPDELKKLQDMYDKLSDEMSGVGDDDEAFGFCSIPEYDNKADCEANGGTWTDLDVDTNLDNVDTSTLTSELALQLDELSKCFADPNLKEYLEGL